MFFDWDLGPFAVSGEYGNTALHHGKLAYLSGWVGPYYGSLFMGTWGQTGHYVRRNNESPRTTSELLDIIQGRTRQATAPTGDLHYLQGVGPLSIRAGRKASIYAAIVVGRTWEEFMANANAAIADWQARTATP
jgi:hypothetical protein